MTARIKTLRERQRCIRIPPGTSQSLSAPFPIKKMRPGVVGPAAIFVGVLPASAKVSQEGSNYIVGTFIAGAGKGRNTAKVLGLGRLSNPFIFSYLVGLSRLEFGEFLGSAAGPVHDDFFDFVLLAHAEGDGEFGLGKIAGAATHEARLDLAVGVETYGRTDGIAIGFCADQIASAGCDSRLADRCGRGTRARCWW